jgi:hypothetical protein
MDHPNTRVASKVLLIQSENVRDPVDGHGGHQISVMHLNPRDGMSYHQIDALTRVTRFADWKVSGFVILSGPGSLCYFRGF